MVEVDTAEKPASDAVDRIVLRAEEARRLEGWRTELNRRFDGMVRVTKSDLANFLIRHHSAQLSEAEIALLEAELYDEVRWLNWALGKIREAKKEGRVLALEDLMVKRKQTTLPKAGGTKRARKKSIKGANDETPGESGNGEKPLSDSLSEQR